MSSFRSYSTTVKHGLPIQVHQFIDESRIGLNTDTPQAFKPLEKTNPALDLHVACYFAELIKNRELLIRHYDKSGITKLVLFWFRAGGSAGKITTLGYDKPIYGSPEEREAAFTKDYDYYWQVADHIQFTLAQMIRLKYLFPYREYFEDLDFLLINEAGKEKLKQECPNVWDKFGLDNEESTV